MIHMFDVAEMTELNRKAAGADLHFASDDELLAAALGLVTARAALDAADSHVLAELEARQVCDRQLGSNTATWLAHETRADRVTLRSRVNVATRLRHPLGEVDDALSDGRITFDHARALARAASSRIVDEVAREREVWIARASDRPFRVWLHELNVWAELVDQDGPFDPNRDLARNKMSMRPLGGDGIMFKGELHGEFAIGFKQRVEARAERLWDRAKADHAACPELEIPPYDTLMALALEELTREGAAADDSTSAAPVDVTLVLNDDDPNMVTNPDGDIRLPAERLAHLLCDAQLTMLATNVLGVILNLGRSIRYANRAQRRALAHRDGGCVFPGCSARASWCDAHHVEHWEHDGPTDMCNLALLCRHHHGVTHRKAWTMVATDDDHFIWTTPEGRTLYSQRHGGRPPPGS
jgi:Domain of unknown function (DUF222)